MLSLGYLIVSGLVYFVRAQNASTLQSEFTTKNISAVFPSDAAYSGATSPFNQRFDSQQPAAVTLPNSASDVATIIQAANQAGFRSVARSGGHSYVGQALTSGSVVIDLANLKSVTVDVQNGTATIQAGAKLGDVALALANAGKAIPHGTCPYVGVGGHFVSGGFGFSSRMWGLSLDQIFAYDLVFANGTAVTVTNATYPDLFWGMRGAGSSFALVTQYHVNTHDAPAAGCAWVYTYNLDVPTATKALVNYQSFVSSGIPAELGINHDFGKGSSNGTVAMNMHGTYYGSEPLAQVLAPLLSQLPAPSSTKIQNGTWTQTLSYLASQPLNTTGAADYRDTFYAKSLMTPASQPMSNTSLQAFVEYAAVQGFQTDLKWFVQFELYGGSNSALSAVPVNDTAFVHRDKTFNIQFYASSSNGYPPFPSNGVPFVDGMVSSITSNEVSDWPYGAYLNYIDDQLANWQQLYYGSHYSRLSQLKSQYDPNNVFKFVGAVVGTNSTNSTSTDATNTPSSASQISLQPVLFLVLTLALFPRLF